MPDRAGRTHGDTQVLSSVTNAARILKEFGKGDKEIGVSELARRLGLGKSSTHRLVHTLTVERLLDQNPQTGLYRLAVTMHQLGSQVQEAADLHTAANPVVEQLRNLTKETVQIAVLDGRHVVYVVRRESPQTVRLFGRVGHRNHAHCTSTGKVLLAGLPRDELDVLLAGWRLARRTPYTITTHAALLDELDTVRERGWADNINESEVGVASVAAPIRDATGVVAAVSIAGPIQRLEAPALHRHVRPVVEAAAAISRRLGWPGEPDPR